MTEAEFYEKIPDWIKQDISNWTHITTLAFFCYKYEQKNGVRFTLTRSRKGVELSKESADFAKLFKLMAPQDYSELSGWEKAEVRRKVNLKIKNFISWMFDYKYRSGEKSVNGTRIFHAYNLINEFERMYAKYMAKQKTMNKMDLLLKWCQEEASEIFNYHQIEREDDLLMLKSYAEQYDLQENSTEKRVIAKAIEVGLL
jgi:hypothetical protein